MMIKLTYTWTSSATPSNSIHFETEIRGKCVLDVAGDALMITKTTTESKDNVSFHMWPQ